MYLHEANKTGKRYRMTPEMGWQRFVDYDTINVHLALSDTWEVEPSTITITREEFDRAWQRAYDPDDCGRDNHNALAKELGFPE